MVNQYAKILGFTLLLVGVLGGMDTLKPDGKLLGLFMVDPMHNSFHFMSGFILLAAGMFASWESTRKIVLVFAALYGILTIMGFLSPDGVVLGMPMNMADNVLHLSITAISLVFALPVQHYPLER